MVSPRRDKAPASARPIERSRLINQFLKMVNSVRRIACFSTLFAVAFGASASVHAAEAVSALATGAGEETDCHPSCSGVCLPLEAEDVDCLNGRGDGPIKVAGPFFVTGPDPYDLDRDKDGVGCEWG